MRKVSDNGMSCEYKNNKKFKKFIQSVRALAYLPLTDIQSAIDTELKGWSFEDERVENFKNLMIDYIQDYWVDGVFPPRVWNVWKHTDDATNNQNEGKYCCYCCCLYCCCCVYCCLL